jgi:hypothetical protein
MVGHFDSKHLRRFLRRMAIHLIMAICLSFLIFLISKSIVGSLVIGGVFLLYLLQDVYFDYMDTKKEEKG